jgi:hypothetical protein
MHYLWNILTLAIGLLVFMYLSLLSLCLVVMGQFVPAISIFTLLAIAIIRIIKDIKQDANTTNSKCTIPK